MTSRCSGWLGNTIALKLGSQRLNCFIEKIWSTRLVTSLTLSIAEYHLHWLRYFSWLLLMSACWNPEMLSKHQYPFEISSVLWSSSVSAVDLPITESAAEEILLLLEILLIEQLWYFEGTSYQISGFCVWFCFANRLEWGWIRWGNCRECSRIFFLCSTRLQGRCCVPPRCSGFISSSMQEEGKKGCIKIHFRFQAPLAFFLFEKQVVPFRLLAMKYQDGNYTLQLANAVQPQNNLS